MKGENQRLKCSITTTGFEKLLDISKFIKRLKKTKEVVPV